MNLNVQSVSNTIAKQTKEKFLIRLYHKYTELYNAVNILVRTI